MTADTAQRTVSRPLRALGVRPGEQDVVVWVGSLFFVTLASASLGLNVADALFFVRFGVEFIPWMILISGAIVMATTIAYSAGLSRFGARAWVWKVYWIFAVWAIVLWFGVSVGVAGIYPIVWQSGQVILLVSFTLIWNAAGEVCTTRQAKRLFPLFASASIAGGVTGNALTGPLAALVGTENLLLIEAVLLALAGLVALVAARRFFAPRSEKRTSAIANLKAGYTTIRRVPLFQLIAGAGVALSVLFFLVFFPFSEAVADSFESEEAIAGYLGVFSAVATAVTFLVSLLFANRLFAKVGVVAVFFMVPLVYAAGFALWLFSFGLVTATLVRALQWITVNALGSTAFSSLFNVLSGPNRSQVRAFVSGIPMQIGTMASGVVLLVSAELSTTIRTLISLVLAIGFLLLVWRMRPAYTEALVAAVREGVVNVFTATNLGLKKTELDADTMRAMTEGLCDEQSGRRRVAVDMLAELGSVSAVPELIPLLGDPDARVRAAAVDALAAMDGEALGNSGARLLEDPSADVRARAAALLDPLPSAAVDLLADADPIVRATIAGRLGGTQAEFALTEMLEDDRPEFQAAALKAVGSLPDYEVDVGRYATHRDRRVRAAAANAAGLDDLQILLKLLEDLSPHVRNAAATALLVHPEGHTAALDVLDRGSVRASEATLRAVVEAGGDDALLREWAATELGRAAQLDRYQRALEDKATATAEEYLEHVLETRVIRVERWIITALTPSEDNGVLPLVTRGIRSRDPETASQALEALESLADRKLARQLIELIDAAPSAGVLDRRVALREMAGDFDPWIRALATRALAQQLTADLAELHDRSKADESDVVRAAVPAAVDVRADGAQEHTIDVVLSLQRVPMFSRLDPEDLEMIARISKITEFDAGERILEYGAAGDEMIVIVAGSATVLRPNDAGGEVLAVRGQGEHVGELGVLLRQPRMAEVVAGPDGTKCVVVSGRSLRLLVAEHTGLATALMATLAERLAAASALAS